jgi:hypothetical protein
VRAPYTDAHRESKQKAELTYIYSWWSAAPGIKIPMQMKADPDLPSFLKIRSWYEKVSPRKEDIIVLLIRRWQYSTSRDNGTATWGVTWLHRIEGARSIDSQGVAYERTHITNDQSELLLLKFNASKRTLHSPRLSVGITHWRSSLMPVWSTARSSLTR